MNDINNDILHTHLVMNGRRFPNYNRIYFHSNENLKEITSFIDASDKDILTVLASGDQSFYFYNNGARRVDVFDKNKLAIHYYYIRLWTMKYLNRFYPKCEFDIEFIRGLLSLVKISSEEEKDSFDYWCKYIEMFDNKMSSKLFYRGLYESVNELDDFSKVRSRIGDEFSFYYLDIGKNSIPTNKKYDLVYISNISDYIEPNINSFRVYRDNLNSVLKDGGKILSINLRKLGLGERDLEKEVFSETFDMEELPEIERYDFKIPAGRVYKR